jgi:N-acetyl-anhydromuramyl-L-alanine amidase AmpD
MTNELANNSSSRGSTPVIWVGVHTAEGPVGKGAAQNLLAFFKRSTSSSCHAIADDDVLLDNLVPYARSAWTLRNGNSRSDNIELCGLAGWSRAEWLQHPGLIKNCAKWVASRCKARGIPLTHIGAAGVRSRSEGVIGHVDYTNGTGDGTHWDPGPGFPWDIMLSQANAILHPSSTPQEDDDVSVADVKTALAEVLHITDLAVPAGQANNNKLYAALLGAAQTQFNEENATQNAIAALNSVIANVSAAEDIDVDTTAQIAQDVRAILAKLGVNDPPQ